MKSPITTHVLDTALGKPAGDLPLTLERQETSGSWTQVATRTTNSDGRVADLLAPGELTKGLWRITFDVEKYHQKLGVSGFYPYVSVTFRIETPEQHFHVPLLLSPFGYSTYRGS